MSGVRIAVVGAGIGGMTAAAALWHNGVPCDVYEQAAELGEVGAGIQLAPNATRILHRLGLADHLAAVAVRPRAIEMRRWDDNRVLRRTDLDRCDELFGGPYYTVHRADLHRGLLGLLPAGTVHTGRRLVGLAERPGGTELRFADGTAAHADLVVGADGIHSVVRDTLAADRPRFSGQSIYRALVPADRLGFLLEEPRVVLWLGPERHCVCYPVSAGRMVSVGATAPVGDWRVESWSARGEASDLTAQYRGWNAEVRAVLSAADTVNRWALHDRDPLDRWSRGRVTVLGDAAHPMLPFFAQGANQAVEDAAALSVVLRGTGPEGLTPALSRYERLRRDRTAEVHRISRTNTSMLHLADGAEQRRRDQVLAEHADLGGQAWLYGYDAEHGAASAASAAARSRGSGMSGTAPHPEDRTRRPGNDRSRAVLTPTGKEDDHSG